MRDVDRALDRADAALDAGRTSTARKALDDAERALRRVRAEDGRAALQRRLRDLRARLDRAQAPASASPAERGQDGPATARPTGRADDDVRGSRPGRRVETAAPTATRTRGRSTAVRPTDTALRHGARP